MASAVSPSASGQVFPVSRTIQDENSCFFSRRMAAVRNRTSARRCGVSRFQVSKAFAAAWTAISASRVVAAWNRPTIWEGWEGLRESKVLPTRTLLPSDDEGVLPPQIFLDPGEGGFEGLSVLGLGKVGQRLVPELRRHLRLL